MRVAINGWFWDQPSTGSGQYLRGLVNGLASLEADLDLTLIIPHHITRLDGLAETVSIAQAEKPSRGQLGKVNFEQRIFPQLVKRVGADVAHVPYWGPPLNSSARLVISILDVIPLTWPAYRGGLGAKLYTSLAVAASKGVGHVLTLSEASKNEIVTHLGLPAEHITATPLAVDTRFTPQADPAHDEAVRQKYDLPDEFALYLGSFDQRKNVNNLLLAWTYVGQPLGEHIPLVLAGKQPSKWGTPLYPDLKQYAKDLKIEKYLQWLGAVDEADKPALYRLAKVFIFPSKAEGFGLPPLEAMACATPVVASNASSIPEVVGDAAYLVDPDNPRDMAGAILAVLVQPDLHQHLANAGRGRASAFSWRKTAQKTLSVYEKLLNA